MKKQKYLVDLYTPEGEELIASGNNAPWNVYPRPHLKRESFFSLNGEWDLAVRKCSCEKIKYGEKILVPFVPESTLSRIGRDIEKGAELCYKREFSIPEEFVKSRVILHFGAVDQIAEVYLNGNKLGEHRGGYGHFFFDITEHLSDVNVLEVRVKDELDNKILPYGKQRRDRGGMWYTPISGIWQSVWLESVPQKYIEEINIVTDEKGADISLECKGKGSYDGKVVLHLPERDKEFKLVGSKARINIDEPVFWSPENPHLYEISVCMGEDRIESYFAIRTLTVQKVDGLARLCLNGKPYFFHGLLDQGYFSDGIFLPASPEGYERDILAAKRLGYNMLRKHIKVEPELFYYYCDKLGMAVFQDMVNNSEYSFLRDTALPTIGIRRLNDKHLHKNKNSREAFLAAMDETVAELCHHPSVVYYTIFNEGWGQFDHASAYKRLRALDDSRFIDSVSGWFMPKKSKEFLSDVESLHIYFKPVKIGNSDKPIVLSEFGGYSYKIEGHSFNLKNNYGYRTISGREEFCGALDKLYREEIIPLVKKGLCADVYTQLTDVEDETNGLLTYDRKVVKVDEEKMKEIARLLYAEIK